MLCMSYIDEKGECIYFRLMDRIKPRLIAVAIALGFPEYVINILGEQSNPVYYLLSEWREGRNPNHSDSRPLTWGTLITALRHAGLPEEVRILERFLVAPVNTVSQASK